MVYITSNHELINIAVSFIMLLSLISKSQTTVSVKHLVIKEIKSLENYPNCIVAIYNRWREKLYSSVGYPVPWDGTYKGVNLPVDTYYYIINLGNGVKAISGWVAIVK